MIETSRKLHANYSQPRNEISFGCLFDLRLFLKFFANASRVSVPSTSRFHSVENCSSFILISIH